MRVSATKFPRPIRNDLLECAVFDRLHGTVPDLSIVPARSYAAQGSALGSVYSEATRG